MWSFKHASDVTTISIGCSQMIDVKYCMALTCSFVGYREPETDEKNALAQAYEYLLARLT